MTDKENALLWKEFKDFCKLNKLKANNGKSVRLFCLRVKGVIR
jgi:hypothetical protein